jgi:hypothetical protein
MFYGNFNGTMMINHGIGGYPMFRQTQRLDLDEELLPRLDILVSLCILVSLKPQGVFPFTSIYHSMILHS